jgi:hypothetical protein
MLPLNCFITENRSKINHYLKKVCLIDAPEAQIQVDKTALASLSTSEPKEYIDFPYINSCVQDCSEMFELHRILDHSMHRLIPNILRLKKARNLNPKTTKEAFLLKEDDVIGVLQGLGSSPRTTKSFYFVQHQIEARVPSPDATSTTPSSSASAQDKRQRYKSISKGLSATGLQSRFLSLTVEAQEAISSIKKSSIEALGATNSPRTDKPTTTTTTDPKDISSQKVVYIGAPNKKGEPVVYVILDRLKEEVPNIHPFLLMFLL